MSEQDTNKVDFLVALINEFGRRFGISDHDAYCYIERYGGVPLFLAHYDILHTLSFRDMVDWMASVCNQQGGQLK